MEYRDLLLPRYEYFPRPQAEGTPRSEGVINHGIPLVYGGNKRFIIVSHPFSLLRHKISSNHCSVYSSVKK